MSKVTGPLMSLSAQKTLANTLTFQKRKSNYVVYLKTAPGDKTSFTPSLDQLAQRQNIAELVAQWKALTNNQKEEWNQKARSAKYFGGGYHYYIHKGGSPPENPKAVRTVYLYPADGAYNSNYYNKILQAAQEIESWYGEHAEFGKTYYLNDPIVEVYQTLHNASFYPKNTADFFFAVKNDLAELAGAIYSDPQYRWVGILDVDSGTYPGASALGITELSQMHLLRFVNPVNYGWACGSYAHELGHDFWLPHPVPADDSIMWTGLFDFPDTFINEADKYRLQHGEYSAPFFIKNWP